MRMPSSPVSSSRPVPIPPPPCPLLSFPVFVSEVSEPPVDHILNHDFCLLHLSFDGPHLLALHCHEIHQLCHTFLLHQPGSLPQMMLRIADEEKEHDQKKEESKREKRKEERGKRKEESGRGRGMGNGDSSPLRNQHGATHANDQRSRGAGARPNCYTSHRLLPPSY